jgi:hypothetical protein
MSDFIPGSAALKRDDGATRPSIKSVPALLTVILVGLSLYASQVAVPPARSLDGSIAAAGAQEETAQTKRAVAAAEAFLNLLSEDMQKRALLEFDSPKRAGWSNLPVTMVPRNGVRLGDLSKEQHAAAMKLVAAVLSKEGYQKVVDIMNGDQVLATGGGGKGGKGKGGKGKGGKAMFGSSQYFIALFGKPSPTRPWMLQFGGHHLGLNVIVVDKNFVVTPTHTGAQPDTFTWKGKTVRPLGPENDRAFALINALDAKQQAQAILGDRPKNLILGPGQDGKKIQPQGIKGSALTDRQRSMMLELIAAWVNILPNDAAAARLAEIKGTLNDTYFAWYGPTTNGSAVYFRVQGPSLVIEYAPQGSTSHIHTIIRDPGNDYAEKLTKR